MLRQSQYNASALVCSTNGDTVYTRTPDGLWAQLRRSLGIFHYVGDDSEGEFRDYRRLSRIANINRFYRDGGGAFYGVEVYYVNSFHDRIGWWEPDRCTVTTRRYTSYGSCYHTQAASFNGLDQLEWAARCARATIVDP